MDDYCNQGKADCSDIQDIRALGPEVERVQKYSTQVKVPLHYWNFT